MSGEQRGQDEVLEPGPDEVDQRLREIGIPVDRVREALRRAHLAGEDIRLDPAFPRTFGGQEIWGHGNGNFRALMKSLVTPWSFDDKDNIPWVVSPDGRIGITMVRGNKYTGIDKRASTRRPRRTAGIRIIRANNDARQYELIRLQPPGRRGDVITLPANRQNYFLLYNQYIETRMGLDINSVRWELSLAMGVTRGGRLIQWQERLVLPEFDLYERDPDGGRGHPLPPPPDVHVPVERIAG